MELVQRWAWTFGLAGMLSVVGGTGLWWAFGTLEGAPRALLVAGAVCLLLYALFDRDNLGSQLQSRGFLHGSTSVVITLLAGVACVATYTLARQNDHTWDLTREGVYTLSDHSVRILAGIDEPVEVLAFFRGDSEEARSFRSLMDRVANETDKLEVSWVDPLRQPRVAEQNDVTSERGTVVLKTADGREQRLDLEFDEETLVKRLVLLLSREEHRICWSLGHGEPDPDDEFSDRGMGLAVLELDELNYQVTRQTIPTAGIDRACDALVIANPTADWAAWEVEALAAYLGEGGRVLALIDPDSSPFLAQEMERFGFAMRPDFVLDLNPENQLMGVDDPVVLVLHGQNLLSHPITANLAAAVILPLARSVEPLDREGLKTKGVLVTSMQSWGETDPQGDPNPDEGTELVSEVPVMATAEIEDPAVLEVLPHETVPQGADPKDPLVAPGRAVPVDYAPEAGGRLVVVGDVDFAANLGVATGNNRDLFLNSIAWLVEEEAQIGERADLAENVALDQLAASLLCLVSLIFVPGGVGLIGVFVVLRRRRL